MVGWRSREMDQRVLNWLDQATALGFKMCIVSNSLGKRVKWFGEKLGIPGVSKAVKPRKRAFLKAMEMLGSTVKTTIIIGDQIFTDVLGGNLLGVYTILVFPVDKKEFFTTFFLRGAEKIILRKLTNKGMLPALTKEASQNKENEQEKKI